jgi:hypothetical protein
MASGSQFRTIITGTKSRRTRQSLRLTVKPHRAAMGMIDGAWWPRSREPLAEFPAMIAGIERRLGRPDRVAFNVNAWAEAPGRIVVDDEVVRLEGFRSLDERTVLVSGYGWHRMVLLVIPPEADEHAAAAALARAAAPDNIEEAAQILIRCGIDPGLADVPIPAPADGRREVNSRWEAGESRVYQRL